MDDRQIIVLYERRDEDAISATAEKYGKYCAAIAENILADRQDAEECVNDAYLRVWNSIPPQKPQSLKLFLARVVRNVALDRLRMKGRVKRGGGEVTVAIDEIGEIASDIKSPEDELAAKELVKSINNFLLSLSQRDRGIFVRRYFYVETAEKISNEYGMSQNAVLKVLSRSRQKLKKYLESEGYTV